jgi:antirestriction protein ArdC
MGATFLAAEAGIDTDGLLDNSAAYISSWVKALRDNKKLVVLAAAKAQKAADHILGRAFEGELQARAA